MTSPLIISGDDPHTLPPLFITGRRGTARVDLAQTCIKNVAFSPVEAFRSIDLTNIQGRTHTEIYTNHLVHQHYVSLGLGVQISLLMAQERAWMVMIVDPLSVHNGRSTASIDLEFRVTANLDYIHKFQGRRVHTFSRDTQGILITQPDHPELVGFIRSDLSLQFLAQRSASQDASSSFILRVNVDRPGAIFWGAGIRDRINRELQELDLATAQQELDRVMRSEYVWIRQGAQLVCPEPELNRFFQLSRCWFHKSVRRLPFGPPYGTTALDNQEIDVLSASPDYHGLFANDCVQSSLEGMLVAPALKESYRQGMEALYRHAVHWDDQIPESIELIHGDPTLFYARLRIGQHPEWIVSYASFVLLTGDRDWGERLWPGLKLALSHFVDPWDVGLNVWDTAAYPEQPDTQGYRFGRVYAQAWWIWAFQLGAELAEWLGYRSDQDQLLRWREKARAALETYFGRPDGYGAWLSETGELHPHQDHEMIIPLALGVAPAKRAARAIDTILSPEMWLDPVGPRRANIGSDLRGGDWVWGFMRWNFVQALFQYGKADRAVQLAKQWAQAELESGLRAAEVASHRTATGITGEGYVWTAARAIRALSYGLFGIQLKHDGLIIDPRLPIGWPEMSLLDLPFRDRVLDIQVRWGAGTNLLNGQDWNGPRVLESHLDQERNLLQICLEPPEAMS